jgi:hypothetical protein
MASSSSLKLIAASLLAASLTGSYGCSWIDKQLDRGDKSTVEVRTPANVQGVKHLESYEDVNGLLSLTEKPDVAVLAVSKKLDAQGVSDAHLKVLTDWIEAGGTPWVAGGALDSGFVHSLVGYEAKDFAFKKSATGKRGGELIVRDLTPNLKINQHPLTQGVGKLYVYPRYAIEASDPRETIPLIEMTDSDGKHGVVLAARALGRGFVVLDGTARGDETSTASLPGFDPAHPNAEMTPDGYQGYDWDKLFVNAVELAQNRLQESGIYARPANR